MLGVERGEGVLLSESMVLTAVEMNLLRFYSSQHGPAQAP